MKHIVDMVMGEYKPLYDLLKVHNSQSEDFMRAVIALLREDTAEPQ
jgi:hypothetical protein